jgi:hypothetical protein
MIATEHHELVLGERLHADRDPVDAGRAPGVERRPGEIGRVRFDRDLAGRVVATRQGLDDVCDVGGSPQRRRAAAEVDRDKIPRLGSGGKLGEDGVAVALVWRVPDLDRKVAIRAQLAAPWEVDVDA